MSRRVNLSCEVKGLIPGATAKASVKSANELLELDPNLGDLTLTRMKRR